jgi:signal transduction histidine kinase
MGLYIASEIIKEHNGEIRVESKLNEGSVFSFSLPLVRTIARTGSIDKAVSEVE